MDDLTPRRARRADLEGIVALLADDDLGRGREDAALPLDPRYLAAFEAVTRDPNQLLAVVEVNGAVVGCLQVTFIPGISRRGMWRGQLEAVRVHASQRGRGLGRRMIEWALERCRERGCELVQLTSDKSRDRAHDFYADLGFEASHEGFKRAL